MRPRWEAADSSSRTLALALALFVAVQVADACSTAAGVALYGPAIEANPVLALLMNAWGTTAGLLAGKLLAVAGGAILYLNSRHLTLNLLTVGYVYAALVPWAWVLAR